MVLGSILIFFYMQLSSFSPKQQNSIKQLSFNKNKLIFLKSPCTLHLYYLKCLLNEWKVVGTRICSIVNFQVILNTQKSQPLEQSHPVMILSIFSIISSNLYPAPVFHVSFPESHWWTLDIPYMFVYSFTTMPFLQILCLKLCISHPTHLQIYSFSLKAKCK